MGERFDEQIQKALSGKTISRLGTLGGPCFALPGPYF